MNFTIAEAEKHFDALVDFAIAGEQVIICVDDHNTVQLVPIDNPVPVQSSAAGLND